ncbi:SGNH/GDSL hydrolase family protein [Pendulispora brunnea]|uniref:SGNH/GDSL hydrolase family protein n=1 Tax=Pendulispora brunnea TaxID=2905690 RepID=A0ABZ2KLS8_9BACT
MAIAPLVGAVVLHGGCSHSGDAPPPQPAPSVTESASAAPAAVAPAPLEADAGIAAADARDAGPPVRVPSVVLHVGDSTVGYYGGLSRALSERFKAEGAQYISDVWTSASVVTFDNSDKFKKLIAKHNPDLILITLGTNDVFIPSPQGFAHHVANIAKRTEGRECIWIGPPTWKKDTGIVEVIRQNSAPCRFFDSSMMKMQRRVDGIHPTDKGGETWAGAFWEFYRGSVSNSVTAQ